MVLFLPPLAAACLSQVLLGGHVRQLALECDVGLFECFGVCVTSLEASCVISLAFVVVHSIYSHDFLRVQLLEIRFDLGLGIPWRNVETQLIGGQGNARPHQHERVVEQTKPTHRNACGAAALVAAAVYLRHVSEVVHGVVLVSSLIDLGAELVLYVADLLVQVLNRSAEHGRGSRPVGAQLQLKLALKRVRTAVPCE